MMSETWKTIIDFDQTHLFKLGHDNDRIKIVYFTGRVV